jgi:hypothetical protein
MTKAPTNNKKDISGTGQATHSKSAKKAAKALASSTSPYTRVKLKPQRPVPTVHPASNVTGPRSSHVEGKNVICVTRATKLGAYLRRCKSLILDDG